MFVWMHTCLNEIRAVCSRSNCRSESVGCSGSVATAAPPDQIYSQHRAGSQLALSSPPLMSMADPRQTPLGTGV